MVFPSTFSHLNDSTMSTHSKIAAMKPISLYIFFFRSVAVYPKDHSFEAVQAPNGIFNSTSTSFTTSIYLHQVLETIYSIPTWLLCRAYSAVQPSSVTHRNVQLLRNGKPLTHVLPAAFDRHRKCPNRATNNRHILRGIDWWSFPSHASLLVHRKAVIEWINQKKNLLYQFNFHF